MYDGHCLQSWESQTASSYGDASDNRGSEPSLSEDKKFLRHICTHTKEVIEEISTEEMILAWKQKHDKDFNKA